MVGTKLDRILKFKMLTGIKNSINIAYIIAHN